MKTFAIILFVAAILFAKSTGQAAPSSLELVLTDQNVSFTSATNISMEAIFRNIGETNMGVAGLLNDLSVVWDGKEYMRDPKRTLLYQGPPWLGSEKGEHYTFSLSDYLVPPERLTFGRHTIAVRAMTTASNILTIFIVPVRKQDPNVTFSRTTTSRGLTTGGGGGGGGGTNRSGF